MKQHGPWTIIKSREIYRDPWLTLNCDDVLRPDGNPGTYSTIQLKPGVTVIALGDHQEVYLTREFHYAVGRYTIEGASGGIEANETALESGKRELREELGIIAETWIDLGVVDPFTAAILSPTHLFAARNLSFVATQLDATEQIECVKFNFENVIQMVMDSEITHAPTCAALLKLVIKRNGQFVQGST